jgi:hypothetical protein
VPIAPWTQTLSLHWRAALPFYAERVAILEEFDHLKALRAFRVGVDQIDARILDGHELSVRFNGLSLQIFGQDADVDEVWRFLTIAVEKVSPGVMGGASTQFQHLVALDLPYDDAVPAARDAFLAPLAGEEVQDFALLVNLPGSGDAPGNHGPSVEFGVIHRNEAELRLSRVVGRIREDATTQLPPSQRWETKDFPETGLYAVSGWSEGVGSADLADIRGYLESTRGRAGEFVECLYEKMIVKR